MKLIQKVVCSIAVVCAISTAIPVLAQTTTSTSEQSTIQFLQQQITLLTDMLNKLIAERGGSVAQTTASSTTPMIKTPSVVDGVVFKIATSSLVYPGKASSTVRYTLQFPFTGREPVYTCVIPAGKSSCIVEFQYDLSSTTYPWRDASINRDSGALVTYLGRSEPRIGNNFPKKGSLQYEVQYAEDQRRNIYPFAITLESTGTTRSTKTYGKTLVVPVCADGTAWSGTKCITSKLEITSGLRDEVFTNVANNNRQETRRVCYIQQNKNSCNVSVDWQIGDAEWGEEGIGNLIVIKNRENVTNPEFVREFKVLSSSGAGSRGFDFKGPPQPYQLILSEAAPTADGYSNGFIILQSSPTFSVQCAAQLVWDVAKGVCVTDLNVSATSQAQTVPEGTFTTTSPCVVSIGSSTCQIKITWAHPQSTIDPTIKVVETGALISKSRRENQFTYTLKYSASPIRIGSYSGSKIFSERGVTFRCATGSAWNGTVCAGNTQNATTKSVASSTDAVQPIVSITTPVSTARGVVPVAVTATDIDSGVKSVRLTINGIQVGQVDSTTPYTFTWDTTTYTIGAHVLVAVATDAAGNIGQAVTVVRVVR